MANLKFSKTNFLKLVKTQTFKTPKEYFVSTTEKKIQEKFEKFYK